MVLKLCDSRSRYKFVAIYLLYGLCIQISVCLDPCDPKTSRPVNMLSIVSFCITKCILILFTENGLMLCHVE